MGITRAPGSGQQDLDITIAFIGMAETLSLKLIRVNGTVSLAVVLARSILERKNEIALLQSLGFTSRQISGMLVREYIVLLFYGISIGFLSAAIAVLPNFISQGSEVSFSSVLLIVFVIFANGVIWIVGLSKVGLKKKRLENEL